MDDLISGLGDSAGGIFTRVFFARDRLLIDHDVLSCGPTPVFKDLESWSRLRLDFWNGTVPGHVAEHVQSRFNLLQNAQRLADTERVNIWAATGVSEQLFIAFVVHLVRFVGGDVGRIALVQVDQPLSAALTSKIAAVEGVVQAKALGF